MFRTKVKIMTIKFETNEIGIVGDLHLGNNLNSERYHKIALDYANWLKNTFKEQGIKDIVFLGDIFHNREEIGTRTLQVAHDFFEVLREFNIGIIIGNHDLFYNDRTDVSSISIFKGWKNIHVFQKTELVTFADKKLVFVPWGFKLEEIEPCDYLFGHFEIGTFKLNMYKVCEHGINLSDLWERSPLIFSGHFHCRQERINDGKTMIYVGSCYEQNWGEMDNNKGIYILDLNDGKYRFIKNEMSPIHLKESFSNIISNKESFVNFSKRVAGNFIKIIVDNEESVDKVEKVTAKLLQLAPIDFGVEFSIPNKIESGNSDNQSVSLDMRLLLEEFIDLLDCKVDKNKLKMEIMKIYEVSNMELS